jgi:hypothetical protein
MKAQTRWTTALLCAGLAVAMGWTQASMAQEATKPRIKMGAYYFAGWAGKSAYDDGSVSNAWAKNMPTHYTKLLATTFSGRTPVWGWRDDTRELMERQIDLAADNGVAYFSFCWYWHDNKKPLNAQGIADDPKHLPMKLFMDAKNNSRMEFSLLVANHGGYEIVGLDAWKQAADFWIANYFKHPRYLRSEGKPVVVIFSPKGADKDGLAYLQEAAKKAGFPGVAIAGCGGGKTEDGYSIRTHYNVTPKGAWGGKSEKHAYQEIIEADAQAWQAVPGQAFIPVATQGWDRRPWEAPNGEGFGKGVPVSWYFEKGTPEQFGSMLERLAGWMDANPTAVTKDRLAIIYAWNEIGEGGWLVPCKDDPDGAYLKAIRRVVWGK